MTSPDNEVVFKDAPLNFFINLLLNLLNEFYFRMLVDSLRLLNEL